MKNKEDEFGEKKFLALLQLFQDKYGVGLPVREDIIKCDQCSGRMIERNGKFGSFLGCSNYPRCKNTKKIN